MLEFNATQKIPPQFDLEVFFIQESADKKNKPIENDLPQTIKKSIISDDFKGKYKESTLLYLKSANTIQRTFIVGLGDPKKLNVEKLTEIGFLIGETNTKIKSKTTLIHISNITLNPKNVITSLTDGLHYSAYTYTKYKSEKLKNKARTKIVFLDSDIPINGKFKKELKQIEAVHDGLKLARDLANEPSNFLTPSALRDEVESEFRKSDVIHFSFFDRKELHNKNMNGILSVAKGSTEDPYLLFIHYKPKKKSRKKIALIGKGVTFDSGGISIKPSAQMDEMKFDMAGAASVIGIMKTVARTKPSVEIIALVPAVENMPSHTAFKPGDIIKAYNEKTIEIINTDAEGRLILADALAYAAKKFKPDLLVDFATLTGAVEVALGDKMAGMFTKSDSVAHIFSDSGDQTGDRVWRLPLLDCYNDELESKIADIKNLGSRWGGAVTAAKFLEEFTENLDWVHFDIAGVAYGIKHLDYIKEGATGFGVRLFINALPALEKILDK